MISFVREQIYVSLAKSAKSLFDETDNVLTTSSKKKSILPNLKTTPVNGVSVKNARRISKYRQHKTTVDLVSDLHQTIEKKSKNAKHLDANIEQLKEKRHELTLKNTPLQQPSFSLHLYQLDKDIQERSELKNELDIVLQLLRKQLCELQKKLPLAKKQLRETSSYSHIALDSLIDLQEEIANKRKELFDTELSLLHIHESLTLKKQDVHHSHPTYPFVLRLGNEIRASKEQIEKVTQLFASLHADTAKEKNRLKNTIPSNIVVDAYDKKINERKKTISDLDAIVSRLKKNIISHRLELETLDKQNKFHDDVPVIAVHDSIKQEEPTKNEIDSSNSEKKDVFSAPMKNDVSASIEENNLRANEELHKNSVLEELERQLEFAKKTLIEKKSQLDESSVQKLATIIKTLERKVALKRANI